MKVLGIEASSAVASVAIIEDDKLLGEYTINNKKTHSVMLMGMVDQLLKNTECELENIDLFSVAKGPGSFTGLRIGIATAKGLAHSVNKPVVGVGTLEGLAYNLPFCEHLIVPIMDARRSQVYTGTYIWDEDGFREVEPPRAISIEECINDCSNFIETVFVGDGVSVYKEFITEKLGDKAIFAPATCNMQRASSIAQLGAIYSDEKESYNTLKPFYLRKSQAEREYEEKHKGE